MYISEIGECVWVEDIGEMYVAVPKPLSLEEELKVNVIDELIRDKVYPAEYPLTILEPVVSRLENIEDISNAPKLGSRYLIKNQIYTYTNKGFIPNGDTNHGLDVVPLSIKQS